MILMTLSRRLVLAFSLTVAGLGVVSANSELASSFQVQLDAQPKLDRAGPPQRDDSGILFRFQPAAHLDVANVYLAGSFNKWAKNDDGRISNKRFAMRRAPSGIWYRYEDLAAGDYAYQYVVETEAGDMVWVADEFTSDRDTDGNTLLVVEALDFHTGSTPDTMKDPLLDIGLERVWVMPGQANTLLVELDAEQSGEVLIAVKTPLGKSIYESSQSVDVGKMRMVLPAITETGGYLVEAELNRSGKTLAHDKTVLSVCESPAHDLRYGFYASYGKDAEDYALKTDMLANLYINAVEYYDYFPAHGDYAPAEEYYEFEPFEVAISGLDVARKIDSGHERGILAIAYIAAYAASESMYQQIPDPMTNASGEPLIFNGGIMTEAEANAQGKPMWFWLMNIASGSDWHDYIMTELDLAMRENPEDVVAFDGFEVDTYGHPTGTRFYAPGSERHGDLLADVLKDFMVDVNHVTKEAKPYGLVSLNCIDEFAIEQMYDVQDFIFMEIWRTHAERLADITDICRYHREPRQQRVVLKLYPADMGKDLKSWPYTSLARVIGATLTGGGSLMVVGEPDETTGTMHALNSLYYPDHQPLAKRKTDLVRRYNFHDAMLFGYTHGPEVENLELRLPLPDCITRAFHAPERNAITVQILHTAGSPNWADVPVELEQIEHVDATLPLPASIKPTAVYYASPDYPEYQVPVALDYAVDGDEVSVSIPVLSVLGSLIYVYEEAH